MNKLSCVIFDIDGTVTQTNDLIFASFNHVSSKFSGKVYSPKEIIAMFGPPEEVAIGNIVSKADEPAAMKEFYSFYEKNLPSMAEIYNGIREIIAMLHANGIALAVFTGKGTHTTRMTLDHFAIAQYFGAVVSGSDVVEHKPSAEGIVQIINRLNVKPEEVLMVGDAVSDAKAARGAGVKIASVLWDSYGKDELMTYDVDFRFHTVAELDAWLRQQIATQQPVGN